MPTQPKKPARSATPDVRARAEALRARAAEASADPVLAVIEAGRRLFSVYRAEWRDPDAPGPRPASNALFDHFRDAVLDAKPATAAGAVALARYVADYCRLTGYQFEALDDERYGDDGATALRIIGTIAAAPIA